MSDTDTVQAPVTQQPETPMLQITPQQAQAQLQNRIRSTGQLFYWIAGLSIVNTFLFESHAGVNFLGGLGITQVFDAVAKVMHQESIGFGLDLMMACVYVAMGMAAGRGHSKIFLLGMVLYALDALVLLYFGDTFNVLWHGYFLYLLSRNWQVNVKLGHALAGVEKMME